MFEYTIIKNERYYKVSLVDLLKYKHEINSNLNIPIKPSYINFMYLIQGLETTEVIEISDYPRKPFKCHELKDFMYVKKPSKYLYIYLKPIEKRLIEEAIENKVKKENKKEQEEGERKEGNIQILVI